MRHEGRQPGDSMRTLARVVLYTVTVAFALLTGISCNSETRTREDCEELLTLYTGFLFLRFEDIRTNPDLTSTQRNTARIETNYSFFLLVEDYEDCLEEAPDMPTIF